MTDTAKMLMQSLQYSDLSTFLRARDNREAIASYILDDGETMSFFNQFPGLVYKEFRLDQAVGDLIKIRFYNVTRGVGLPGPYKSSRQLAGSESMSGAAYREETMSVGVHRYAVALENIIDKKVLPETLVAHILGMMASWWTEQDDVDTFCTLFRDYPPYIAETTTLTSTEILERVSPLFGRGTYNNVNAAVQVIFAGAGTKTDIEPGAAVTGFKSLAAGDRVGLADTDTLTDTFLQNLGDYMEQQMGAAPIAYEGLSPFYGLIIDTADEKNIYKNSASTLVANLKAITRNNDSGQEVYKNNPVFTRQLAQLYNIRMFKWGPMAPVFAASGDTAENDKDGKIMKGQESVSIKKGLRGTPINPTAKILAAAKGGETVTGLNVWTGGDAPDSNARGPGAVATDYWLFLSCGANHFPYFDGTALGNDSINACDSHYLNITDATLGVGGANGATYSTVNGAYSYGRFQVGQGSTATTRWKVVYSGPIYSGTIQIGSNNAQFTFIDDAFRVKILGLHRWNAGTSAFDAANTRDADWATFKTFLGINAGTLVIDNAAAFQTRQYQWNRRAHLFDTVRSLAFGRDLIYKIIAGGSEYNEETRDYGAMTGRSMTIVQGKKVVVDAQGLISNYAMVVFKRPPLTI